jgi:hypothetical protein
MRSHARQAAHVLERTGLAMAGAAGGLFVAAHLGSGMSAPTQGFLIVMMIAGAAGFYLGIDTPPHRFYGLSTEIAKGWSAGKIDLAELLTSVGTFLAAVAAVVSVAWIVFGSEPPIASTIAMVLSWVAGTTMQIIAGTIARVLR